MKILLVTSSARGHAIADALARSPSKPEIIHVCPSRNPGIRRLAAEQHVLNIMNFPAVLEVARRVRPDFAFIGPDDPIGGGLADALEDVGINSVAPKKSLARVESSKGFARDVMAKYGIDASPKFKVFSRGTNRADSYVEEIRRFHEFIVDDLHGEYVVKYDALKGGKGVKVSGEHLNSVEEGVSYAFDCLEECGKVVIEEKLTGVEFSLMSFVSGARVVDMPAIQDHKRAHEGDTGPNTGGMGTYTDANHSLPFLTPADLARAKDINRLMAEALRRECPEHAEGYRGILYGGFIATKSGVQVIEFNARFGDPEALNVLPLLESDFVELCQSIIAGELSENMARFAPLATVCKYIVPKSYPDGKHQIGETVRFPAALPDNARIYYGDVTEEDDGTLRLGGSRTAGIVGMGKTIAEAEKTAEELCKKVEGPVRHRADIGTTGLITQRTRMMDRLRG